VANEKILAELQDALKTTKENIQSANRRSGAGVATNADAVQFELEGTTLNQNLKKLMLEQDLLKNRLAVAIGHPNHEAMQVESDFAHPPESVDPKLADGEKSPDTEVLRLEENIHFLKRDKASRWWVPSVDLYATYRRPTFLESDTRALARENELVAGIQLSMNLGAGFEDAAIKSAEELEAKATAEMKP
jgi:outer membrane protein TolC